MKEFIEKLIGRLENKKFDVHSFSDIAWNNAIDECIRVLNSYSEKYMDGWIPCSERLPEVGKDVLVFTEGYLQRVWQLLDHEDELVWEDEFGGWNEFEEVIAWQSLPAPYQPKGE